MSSTPTFFLAPRAIHDGRVAITDVDIVRQMRKVLRLAVGDAFVALDGTSAEYQCVIDRFDRGEVRAHVQSVAKNTRETPIPVHCYPALIKRERFAFALEKCTELGVASYTPIVAERSPYADVTPHLRDRWERIIREAAEVSRRGTLPVLHLVATPAHALAHLPFDGRCFVLTTQQHGIRHAHEISLLLRGATSVHLFIGPEGDYTDDEYALFRKTGVIPLSLGPRIVRSETAAIAAVALMTAFV